MGEPQTRALAVRLDQPTIRKIEAYAEVNGFVNNNGDLNISAALRMLISTALEAPQEEIIAQLWQSARGTALREVAAKVISALKECRETGTA
jgi:activator of 2-hydroxyglutaryl-CoA dehydratase